MRFEIFNYNMLGRHDIIAVDMVHYRGMWGLNFSHHQPNNNYSRYVADTSTEGVLKYIECEDLTPLKQHTITTHHFDSDALISVWCLLNPEIAQERTELLKHVARCGDFFLYLDDKSAKLNFINEQLLVKLRGDGKRGMRTTDVLLTNKCFEEMLPSWLGLLDNPNKASDLWREPMNEMRIDIEYLSNNSRVTELWDLHTSLLEVDHEPDKHALNTICKNDLFLLWYNHKSQREIQLRPAIGWYELQSIPHRPIYNLADLTVDLNAAEPDGSRYWRYKSGPKIISTIVTKLNVQQVLEIIKIWLNKHNERQISKAYRTDVREVFSKWKVPAIQGSSSRFVNCSEVRLLPGKSYGGIQIVEQNEQSESIFTDEKSLSYFTWDGNESYLIQPSDGSTQFGVDDGFYWSYNPAVTMELNLNFRDLSAGEFWIEYDAWSDPFKPTMKTRLVGNGEIQSVSYRLDDARFGNGQHFGDFRLVHDSGAELALSNISLRKLL